MPDSQLCNGIGLKQCTIFCGKEQSKKSPCRSTGMKKSAATKYALAATALQHAQALRRIITQARPKQPASSPKEEGSGMGLTSP